MPVHRRKPSCSVAVYHLSSAVSVTSLLLTLRSQGSQTQLKLQGAMQRCCCVVQVPFCYVALVRMLLHVLVVVVILTCGADKCSLFVLVLLCACCCIC
jgi:hypothetical protein